MRAVCVLMFLLSTAASTAVADSDWIEIDRVVAVVDREVLLESDVVRALSAELQPIKDPSERSRLMIERRPVVIEQLIDEALVTQAGRRATITVEEADIDGAIEEIKKQNQLDDAGLDAALGEAGYTRAQYRIDLERQLLRLKTVNQLIRPRISVTEAEMRAAYDQAKAAGKVDKPYAEIKSEIGGELVRGKLELEVRRQIVAWRADAYISTRTP